ncbi:MAG: type II secretion system F family protein [FCB group bacterium]|jgi:type IV pilus assembly protein PilC|nr:type II secretion system F family protein [FCB group bacterium]
MGLFSSQISTKKLVPLCRQLATADDAGIPIIQSLQLVARQAEDPRTREVLTRISESVRNGSTLSDAARAQSKYLPRFFIELLGTGERGGKLDVMLRELADYYEDRLEIQRRTISALTLPAIELLAAWVFGSFALMLLNQLMGMFKERGGGQAFNFNTFLHDYAMLQMKVGIGALIVLIVCVILSRKGVFKWFTGFFGTFIWPVAPITRRFAMARFLRSMSLLIGSGLNIIRCVENSAAVMVNPYMERDFLKSIPFLRNGQSLYEAFATSRYMSTMSREMIHVGEQSGQLEGSLRKAAEYNMEQANHAVQVLLKVLTVFIIMLVALIVGAVIVTFYSKLYGGMLDAIGA